VKVLLPIERTAGEERALVAARPWRWRVSGRPDSTYRSSLRDDRSVLPIRRFGGLASGDRTGTWAQAVRDMRWEEIWDAALRIRTLLTGPRAGRPGIGAAGRDPVGVRGPSGAVRSSARGDGVKASFAGLHESFLNVKGRTPFWTACDASSLPSGRTGRCCIGKSWADANRK